MIIAIISFSQYEFLILQLLRSHSIAYEFSLLSIVCVLIRAVNYNHTCTNCRNSMIVRHLHGTPDMNCTRRALCYITTKKRLRDKFTIAQSYNPLYIS